MKKENKKYISNDDALKKLQRYCAYQERCHKEVRSKLLDLGVYGEDLENVIVELIQDNFLNEERFAQSYAGGKFRIKKWGKVRIKQELKFRRVSEYCIKKALKEIDDDAYWDTLVGIIKKKNKTLKEPNEYKRKNKLAKHAIQKGYESNLIWEAINFEFNGTATYSLRRERKQIEEERSWNEIQQLLEKKNRTLSEPNEFKRKNKLAQFVIRKGYESVLTWKAIKLMFKK